MGKRALTIREIPEETYEAIAKIAKNKNRSLQQQVRTILEKEANMYQIGAFNRAKKWRKKLAHRNFGNIVKDIRADRER